MDFVRRPAGLPAPAHVSGHHSRLQDHQALPQQGCSRAGLQLLISLTQLGAHQGMLMSHPCPIPVALAIPSSGLIPNLPQADVVAWLQLVFMESGAVLSCLTPCLGQWDGSWPVRSLPVTLDCRGSAGPYSAPTAQVRKRNQKGKETV